LDKFLPKLRKCLAKLRTIYGGHKRFLENYIKSYEGYYFTGDGTHVDTDGHFQITGRVDDVINVSGHRIIN
jgi:acetyl-CoA synthetase